MKETELEKDFVTRLIAYLSKFMYVEQEVRSDCGKGRIDVMAECKLTATRFGIECKQHTKKRGEDIGEFIRQAMRYSKMTFKGKPVPVFIAPPISNEYLALVEERVTIGGKEYILDRHQPIHEHHTVNGILGDFNVGEFRTFKHSQYPYGAFMFSNKPIYSFKPKWDEVSRKYGSDIQGLHKENYASLMQKIQLWTL